MHTLAAKLVTMFAWLTHEEMQVAPWQSRIASLSGTMLDAVAALESQYRPRQKNPVPGRPTWAAYLNITSMGYDCATLLRVHQPMDEERIARLLARFPENGARVNGSLVEPWVQWAHAVRTYVSSYGA